MNILIRLSHDSGDGWKNNILGIGKRCIIYEGEILIFAILHADN